MDSFREIWAVDFEFSAPPGEHPDPVCVVAKELRSGRTHRYWQDELKSLPTPPYSIGNDSLFLAYYASAELGCHLALGWPMPENVLDLFAEFRCLTNGLRTYMGKGLTGALGNYGLGSIDAATKDAMRRLVIRGGPWSREEQAAIIRYCETDVIALERLFKRMGRTIDLPRALLRGRYMKAAARMEWAGVPIDIEAHSTLERYWTGIQSRLISEMDNSGIYEGRMFSCQRFEAFLEKNHIPWPRSDTGWLDLTDETFRDQAKAFPHLVGSIRELRAALSKMRLSDLNIGPDRRNRVLLSAFSSKSSRNQPSNSRFIFGPDTWLRSLIRPEPGRGIAYIDYSQQELGIAAALSGDPLMASTYRTGDCYLEFGKQAGLIPKHGSKRTHKASRDLCKTVILGTQYGMGAASLAQRIGKSSIEAGELLRLHRETYRVFWEWSDSVVNYANLYGKLWTVFGWTLHLTGSINERSVRNFPMQANGAEMLRLACILATERGITVCCPVHDALLIEFPLERADVVISKTQACMKEASLAVLGDFEIRTDVKRIDYPARYSDSRGEVMWNTVWKIVDDLRRGATGRCSVAEHVPAPWRSTRSSIFKECT